MVGYYSLAGLIFLAIAYYILKRIRALTILGAAQLKGSRLGGTPSWTLGWTVEESDCPSRPLTCWQKVLRQGVTMNHQERFFAVTRGSEPLFSFNPSNVFELTICGSVLASISKLGQPAGYNKDPHRKRLSRLWSDIAAWLALIEDLPSAEYESKITASLRTFTADAREAMSFIDKANNKQFSFQIWRENLASNRSDNEPPPALAGISKDDGIRPWRFELAVRDTLLNRQFFITSDSRMGLELDDMREGDLIALFLGTQVPFVVREVASDVYIKVGECYVHGITDGEAMQDTAKWHASLKDIVLNDLGDQDRP